jgi:hypothetical protein
MNHLARLPVMGLMLFFGLVLVLGSCSSNDVASSHFLQKRKHRPGVHLNWGNQHQTKQHAQVQKEDLKKEQHLVLEADDVLVEKPTQKVPDSLVAERSAESVFIKRKKLPLGLLHVLSKGPAFQKMAAQQLLSQPRKARRELNEGDPIEKENESESSKLGTVALIAGIISVFCFLLGILLVFTMLASIAFIPILLAFVSGIVGLITGSLSMYEDQSGKIGLILSAITLGVFLLLFLLNLAALIVLLLLFAIFFRS